MTKVAGIAIQRGASQRLLSFMVWSTACVFVGGALYAAMFYLIITPIGSEPSYQDVVIWKVSAWSAWVVLVPMIVHASESIAIQRLDLWRVLAIHAVLAVLVIGLHVPWYAWISTLTSPYVSYSGFRRAALNYLPWGAPVAFTLYAAIAAASTRAMSSLLSLRATPEGLLVTTGNLPPGSDSVDAPALEANPGPVLVYDPDTLDFLAVNTAAVQQYGWTPQEFLGMSLLDIRAQADIPDLLNTLELMRNLPIWRAHSRHMRKDGSIFDLELTNHAVIFNGRWARMLLVNDVTAAERAQRALAASEAKFRAIFEDAVVGIYQTTPDGRFLMLNRSGARALGYDKPEEAMQAIRDIGTNVFVDPSDREDFLAAIERDGHVSNWMSRLRRRDGTVMWNVENARAVRDSGGNIEYIEGTIKDVTEEVLAREALQESEHKATELRVQLADAQLRALKLQLRPHFLFNILNTVAMMIRNEDYDKAQRMVTMLGEMFRKFLAFEGEDTVSLEQELAFLDLYFGLQQFRYEDRMRLRRDISPDTLDIRVPTLILQPIAENAIKHGVSDSTGQCSVELTSRKHDDTLVIEMINDVAGRHAAGDGTGHGIGLRNTHARLRELYGDLGSFELVPVNGRMHALLRIPLGGGCDE